MVQFKIMNLHTSKIDFVTMGEILEVINKDRESNWVNYDETNFIEGLELFTEWRLLKVIENNLTKAAL